MNTLKRVVRFILGIPIVIAAVAAIITFALCFLFLLWGDSFYEWLFPKKEPAPQWMTWWEAKEPLFIVNTRSIQRTQKENHDEHANP